MSAERFSEKVEIQRSDSDSNVTITLSGDSANLYLGGSGQDGDLLVRGTSGTTKIHLVGRDAFVRVGGDSDAGTISVRDDSTGAGQETIVIKGDRGNIILGGSGQDGELLVRGASGTTVMHLRARDALCRIGGGGSPGIISVRDNSQGAGKETIRLDGDNAGFGLGGNGQDGDFYVKNSAGKITLHLNGEGGDLHLRKPDGTTVMHLRARDALCRIGGGGSPGIISVRDNSQGAGKETIRMDGDSGDIILKNADCAEEFDLSTSEQVEPGTVMVLDQEGQLQPSKKAYDKRVAGVVSGAGDLKPGLILDKKPEQTDRLPIALMGKVYCKVDAQYSPIEVGDLLTASPTPGHAMKATDPTKAFGTVIGKALKPLNKGIGLIPILISLQ